MTTPAAIPDRLAYLDGWRGVSLALVLLGHFFDLGAWVAPLGVEMFFVLSGRLMAELLIVRRQPLPTFLWRRVTRVWPALWIYVGLVTFALAVSARWGDHRHIVAGALAALTFTQNYVSGVVSTPYHDHVWSLSVEEHCYLLLALLAVLAARRPRAAIAGAVALTLAAWLSGWVQTALLGADDYYTYLQTDARAGSVLLPFALYLAAQAAPVHDRLARLPWLAPIALAVGVALTTQGASIRYTAGTAALALGVVALDHAPAPLRRGLSVPALTWLGTASFSLYLWQQPFMMLARSGMPVVACLAGAVGVGLWSYYRVEQPARRRLNAHGSPGRPGLSPAIA